MKISVWSQWNKYPATSDQVPTVLKGHLEPAAASLPAHHCSLSSRRKGTKQPLPDLSEFTKIAELITTETSQGEVDEAEYILVVKDKMHQIIKEITS